MIDENKVLSEFDNLIFHNVRKHTREEDQSKTCNGFDDFLQEGRIAALKAIRTYSNNHNCKLSSYIVNCVRNKMTDLHRQTLTKRNPPVDLLEEGIAELDTRFLKNNESISKYEITSSLTKYLNSEEFELIRPIIEDESTVSDIIDDLLSRKSVGVSDKFELREIKKLCREDVVACLCRVQQLLKLKGGSQRLKRSLRLLS